MTVGFVGLGKLGLPYAVITAQYYPVVGCDVNKDLLRQYAQGHIPYMEEGAEGLLREALDHNRLTFLPEIEDVVEASDLIFVMVQTPHPPEMDGSIRITNTTQDFDYTYLEAALERISACPNLDEKVVAVVCTVLPGTCERILRNHPIPHFIYNPSFIAMGTTIRDFTNPEFVLLGVDDEYSLMVIKKYYEEVLFEPRFCEMKIAEAELTKMLYNTAIGLKICLANTVAMLCHRYGNGVDAKKIMQVLCKANKRLISQAYLMPGMGDSGGCHPRDQIAMSGLSERLNLPYNLFHFLMSAREQHTEWQAEWAGFWADFRNLPIVIMGKTFKAGINITTGSCSILLGNILEEWGDKVQYYDPLMGTCEIPERAIFFLGTNDPLWVDFKFPEGSIIIDPWGIELRGVAGCDVWPLYR